MNGEFYKGIFIGGILAFVLYGVLDVFELGGLSPTIYYVVLAIWLVFLDIYERRCKCRKKKKRMKTSGKQNWK